jgi:hypothetical protein
MEHKGQVGHAKGQGQSYFSETHNIQGMIQRFTMNNLSSNNLILHFVEYIEKII